jgi:RNA polymerase sigma factor (sigma-70 family)
MEVSQLLTTTTAARCLSHRTFAFGLLALPADGLMSTPPRNPGFDTTHWSLVLAAGQQSSPESADALTHLCESYWHPLYAYARRSVEDVHEAQDLTQEFFAQLLEKNYLEAADPLRGRFRSFLLTAFNHFLSKEWKKARAQKRGGGLKPLRFDFDAEDSAYSLQPADDITPEQLYDRRWATTLLTHVLDRLRGELSDAGKSDQFERLKPFIIGQAATKTYASVAIELGMTESAAKMAVYRMRQRYQQLLRSEIAQTVAEPADVDDEIRSLFALFG